MRRMFLWLMLIVSVVGVFLLNYFNVPLHDELGYAFWGWAMPKVGPVARISSFADIVKEQYLNCFVPYGNGRVFVHGIVSVFAVCRAYLLFDVCNTFVWCWLVWLVLKTAGVAKITVKNYLCTFGALFYLVWFAEPCCQNAAYAVNYLWTTTMAVVVLKTWREWRSWLLVPISLFVGWSQESVALPLLLSFCVSGLVRSVRERRLALNAVQLLSLVMMVIGVAMLCGVPAARGRAAAQPITLIGILTSNIPHAIADGVFCFTPLLIALALAWVLYRHCHELREMIIDRLELWLFVFFVIGLYFALVASGAHRILFPGLVVACILLLEHRGCFVSVSRHQGFLSVVCLGWLVISVIVQMKLGRDAMEMIDVYRADSQNVTFWRPRINLLYSATQNYLYPTHWRWLQLECDKEEEPICFSPWFYENFYKCPKSFFAQAKPIPGVESVYVSPSCPILAVKRGADDLTETQKNRVRHMRPSNNTSGWRRFTPGRFSVKFPPDWFYVRMPKESATLIVDGEQYTIYTIIP